MSELRAAARKPVKAGVAHMCLFLFIGSDTLVPEVPFDAAHPGMSVGPTTPFGLALEKQFTKKKLYAIGGWEGCCCSFLEGNAEKCWSDPVHLANGRKDRETFARLVESLLAHQPSVELYAAWISSDKVDDEPVLEKKRIGVRELLDPHTYPDDGSAAFSIEKRSLA